MCMSARAIAENERSLSIHSTQQQPTTATTKRVLQNEKKIETMECVVQI